MKRRARHRQQEKRAQQNPSLQNRKPPESSPLIHFESRSSLPRAFFPADLAGRFRTSRDPRRIRRRSRCAMLPPTWAVPAISRCARPRGPIRNTRRCGHAESLLLLLANRRHSPLKPRRWSSAKLFLARYGPSDRSCSFEYTVIDGESKAARWNRNAQRRRGVRRLEERTVRFGFMIFRE